MTFMVVHICFWKQELKYRTIRKIFFTERVVKR